MADPLEEKLAGIDGPRPLDPEFRARLEHSLVEAKQSFAAAEKAEATSPGWKIDGPREMPPRLRARLEAALTRRSRHAPGWLMTSVAAGAAAVLVAGSVVLVSGREEAPEKRAGAPPAIVDDSLLPAHREPLPPPPGSLHAFASAGEFLRYVRGEALRLAGPYGLRGPSIYGGRAVGDVVFAPLPATAGEATTGERAAPALLSAPAPAQFSTTNVQEEGVDEPDIVKTDGRRLVVLSHSTVWLLDMTRGAKVQGSLDVPDGIGIFLVGDRVIHFSPALEDSAPGATPGHASARPWTKVTVISIANPSRAEIVSSMKVEGSYVGARQAGGVVRLVVQSGALGPRPVPTTVPITVPSQESLAAAEAANKRAIRRSVVGHWLPHYVVERPGRRTATGHVHDWDAVSRPPERSGVSMLTVMTIDPADPRPDNAVSVIGAGEIVYSSLKNLYVTSGSLDDILAIEQGRSPKGAITRIHKFDISDPKGARYLASGEVPGHLLNQFSMSEHEGYLRVATTLGFPWMPPGGGTSESFVTVFAEEARKLVPVGSVGNLGKGERIYSVRFIGAMGYVVTFRQIDPLYVIDIRTPSRPEVKGELKVPGYSAYLHPLGETLLLGVGRYADESEAAKGLQFSLFDVSDPAKPRRLHDRIVGEVGYSEVENDHHTFLYWEPGRFVAVPATIFDQPDQQSDPFVGALAVTVAPDSGFGEPVRLTHTGRPETDGTAPHMIRRSLVIGNRLLTVSEAGVLVSDLQTFADRAWVPLRK